jgi:hypothetical protein
LLAVFDANTASKLAGYTRKMLRDLLLPVAGNMKFSRFTLGLGLAIGLLGCASAPTGRPTSRPTSRPSAASASKPSAAQGAGALPNPPAATQAVPASASHPIGDPRPVVPMGVRINTYQFTLPSRTISRDEAFWKHIDEHAVDAATYDLLYKNGLRVGLGRQNDWAYFHDLLSRQQVAIRSGFSTSQHPDQMEVSLKEEQESQEVFWFDSDSFLVGHRYDHCEDLLSVYFSPIARHSGDVVVSVIPLLRSKRERIRYTVREDEVLPHLTEDYPEFLFDLRLRTVIAAGQFLVIAPSSQAQVAHTIGKTFFKYDGKGEEFETLLIISPVAFRLDEPATQPAGGMTR